MKHTLSNNTQVLLVGHLFPQSLEKLILSQPIPPIQTQRYGLALLNALKEGFKNGHFEAFSTAQFFDYPRSSVLIAPYARWKTEDGTPVTMAPYINTVGLKHLSRFFFTLLFMLRWVLLHQKSNRVVILHGVQSCKIWGVILSQVFGKCTIIPVITDDLAIPQKWEGAFRRNFRRVDLKLMQMGLQKVAGVVVMAPKLAEKLAPGRPILLMPAIQNTRRTPFQVKSKKPSEPFTIVYTGGLSEDYGINLLLDAFQKANCDDWQLLISGWGPLEKTVKDFAEKNSHAYFLGMVSQEELSDLYGRADVLVNPKLSDTAFAEMSFPSKIVEYLGTGKPVVSTCLPVFDDDFKKHLILTQADTPDELIRCLNEVWNWSDQRLEEYKDENLSFVNEQLSPPVQGRRIRDFVTAINTTH